MTDIKMYLTTGALALAFLFHVIGFATHYWLKLVVESSGIRLTFHEGLWETCVEGSCGKFSPVSCKSLVLGLFHLL